MNNMWDIQLKKTASTTHKGPLFVDLGPQTWSTSRNEGKLNIKSIEIAGMANHSVNVKFNLLNVLSYCRTM